MKINLILLICFYITLSNSTIASDVKNFTIKCNKIKISVPKSNIELIKDVEKIRQLTSDESKDEKEAREKRIKKHGKNYYIVVYKHTNDAEFLNQLSEACQNEIPKLKVGFPKIIKKEIYFYQPGNENKIISYKKRKKIKVISPATPTPQPTLEATKDEIFASPAISAFQRSANTENPSLSMQNYMERFCQANPNVMTKEEAKNMEIRVKSPPPFPPTTPQPSSTISEVCTTENTAPVNSQYILEAESIQKICQPVLDKVYETGVECVEQFAQLSEDTFNKACALVNKYVINPQAIQTDRPPMPTVKPSPPASQN